MNRRTFYFLTAALTYLLALTMAAAAGKDGPEAPRVVVGAAQGAAPQAGTGYAGEATCLGCHEDQAYKGTAHGRSFNERTPAATHGCESCHGPGQRHAESGDPELIQRFSRMTPDAVSATCMTCHSRQASHALWDGSQHDQRNISCVTCHSVHASKGPSQLKASTVTQQCATCHRNVTNKQHRFNHMPVREGALTCASCHRSADI